MSVFAELHNLARSFMEKSKVKLEDIDLTLTQAKVLSILANNKEKMIQREIGEKAYLKADSMSRMIDTLEEKGLVLRDENPKSRRSYKIDITNRGLELNKLSNEIFMETEKQLFNNLTKDELNQFVILINKITQGEQL